MARVNIDDGAFMDPRFVVLGQLLGTSEFDALGRMAHVWRWCTDRQQHTVSAALLAAVMRHENASKLVVSSGLGVEVSDGIRIAGTRGRIEWVAKLRKNAKKGGAAKASKRQSKTLPSACQKAEQNASKPEENACPLTLTLTPALTLTPTQEKQSAAPPLAASPVTAFRRAWSELFQAATGSEPTWEAAEAGIAARLVKRPGGVDEATRRAAILLGPDCPDWIARGGRDLKSLSANWDKLVSAQPARASPSRVQGLSSEELFSLAGRGR